MRAWTKWTAAAIFTAIPGASAMCADGNTMKAAGRQAELGLRGGMTEGVEYSLDPSQDSGWQNCPIVKDLVDDEGRSTHPMPRATDDRVGGIGKGYNFICPWMMKRTTSGGSVLTVVLAGKSGSSLMNQAGVWLLTDQWRGNMEPAVGYEILLYGEVAQRVSVYRYDGGRSIEIALFAVGQRINADHEYRIERNAEGIWSASMDGRPLAHGEKDRGTPDITFLDLTYTSFGAVGIYFNSEESELYQLRLSSE